MALPRATFARQTLVVAALAACSSDLPPAPEPEPEPLVYEVRGFRIVDATRAAPAALVDSIASQLEAAVAGVAAFLPEFPAPADTITFRLLEGGGIPFVSIDDLVISQWANDLALQYLPHQVTHLFTDYRRRSFIEEGIAVYVSEMLDPSSRTTNPYRGQPPHAWVSLYEQQGSTISLFTAFRASNLGYSYTGSSPDASAWQVFVEAASFTRWVFDTYGQATWYRLYDLDDLGGALNASTAELEQAWLAAARAAFPNPLSCEEALGTLGPLTTRDEFWCARARGE